MRKPKRNLSIAGPAPTLAREEQEASYNYALAWLARIEPTNSSRVHVRTNTGRVLTTLDQVVEAALTGELVQEAEALPLAA